jgi:hypothetical protein
LQHGSVSQRACHGLRIPASDRAVERRRPVDDARPPAIPREDALSTDSAPFSITGSGVIVTVSWRDQVHAIEIAAGDWALIMSGAGLELQGEDFLQDGEDYETEWDFAGGIDGRLEVRYTPFDGEEWTVGFTGRLSDASIAALP